MLYSTKYNTLYRLLQTINRSCNPLIIIGIYNKIINKRIDQEIKRIYENKMLLILINLRV